jgi:Phage integrase family
MGWYVCCYQIAQACGAPWTALVLSGCESRPGAASLHPVAIRAATPQKSWRSVWRSLRKAAGIGALRFHDLRHHASTELAESQASDATIIAIAGHVSRQMAEHYSHVRLDLKRKPLDGLAARKANSEDKPAGYDTNYDTIPLCDRDFATATRSEKAERRRGLVTSDFAT